MLPRAGRRTRREQVPDHFKTLWPMIVPENGETSFDKILVHGADAVALGRFGYLVRLHLYEDTDLVARAVTASDREGGQEARNRCKSLPRQGSTSS